MKIEKIILIVFSVLLVGLGFSIYLNLNLMRKIKDSETDAKVKKVWSNDDSLKKENTILKSQQTILIQQANQYRKALDSLASIRPTNIKHTNNEVSRFKNSSTAVKLSIGDSILRSRR